MFQIAGYADVHIISSTVQPGVTTNSTTATNCVSLHDLRGVH